MAKAPRPPRAAPRANGPRGAPRVNGPRGVGEIAARAGDASFRRFGFRQATLVQRWSEIVGEEFARHSRPQALRLPRGEQAGGVLHLAVTGAWAPRLMMVEAEIVERANRVLGYGAVARLYLVHGAPPVAAVAAPPAAEPPPVDAALAPSLRAIRDPALLDALTALARRIEVTHGSPVFD